MAIEQDLISEINAASNKNFARAIQKRETTFLSEVFATGDIQD